MLDSQSPSSAGLVEDAEDETERPVKRSLFRGWRRRCPKCGAGPLFKGYLTLRPSCPVCQQDLQAARADDGPAYLTILIVGHLMAPMMIWVFTEFRPEPLIMATGFGIGCTALSLYLLPRLKGLIVAFQWAKRMHGFSHA